MKTAAKIAIAAAVAVAIAYPAAAWFSGKQAEAILANNIEIAQKQFPDLFTVERTYERGIFSSSATHIVSIGEAKVTTRSRIQHGPFAGGSFALAAYDNETTFEGLPPEISELLLGGKPLKTLVVIHSEDHARGVLSLPAFEKALPNKGDDMHIAFGGLAVEWDLTGTVLPLSDMHIKKYAFKGNLPSLDLTDSDIKLVMKGLEFNTNGKRAFDDIDFFFLGKSKISIDDFTAQHQADAPGKATQMQRATYDTETKKKGDFVVVKALLGSEMFKMDGQNYGPARFALSLDHLHAHAFGELIEGSTTLQWNSLSSRFGAPTSNATLLSTMALVAPATTLVEQAPIISLDRIAYETPQGPVTASARITIKGFQQADIAQLERLLKKIEGESEISAPLEFIVQQSKQEDLQPRLDALVAAGYVTLEKGILKAKTTYRDGQWTINGKPFDPSQLAPAMPGKDKDSDDGGEASARNAP
ncbi:MAG: YdgA family protein [Azoarcus sp.]|jgi:uncharacterized protein YdgA (DUF945 family)|nr:YdgA family protein [Azoarcus sp.]